MGQGENDVPSMPTIRELREKQHLTITQAAKKAKITPDEWTRWEQSPRDPKLETYEAIAQALGATPFTFVPNPYYRIFQVRGHTVFIDAFPVDNGYRTQLLSWSFRDSTEPYCFDLLNPELHIEAGTADESLECATREITETIHRGIDQCPEDAEMQEPFSVRGGRTR
jgi:transcriptional regulator with XRE-family HTH domain